MNKTCLSVSDWIQVGVVICTCLSSVVALVIALWGERMRKWANKVSIEIKIENDKGALTYESNEKTEEKTSCRFYHLLVKKIKGEVLHNARIVVTSIDEIIQTDTVNRWKGLACLNWMGIDAYNSNTRTLGATSYYCDFICVYESWYRLALICIPNNLDNRWEGKKQIEVSFKLISDEFESEEYRASINWDGVWKDGNEEMKNHMVVKLI